MIGEFGRRRLPGELYEKWPKTETGEPVPPKFLTHCKCNDFEDTLFTGMLEACGIPAMILHPNDGDFGELILGMSGTGSSIFVPETMYEEAKELMEAEPDDDLQSGI